MSNIYVEHGLTRGRKTASVIFRKRGSSLYVYILEPTDNPDVEAGEAGSVDADECLFASDILKAWVRKGERHPRGGRVPCKLELAVSHYGKVQRIAHDDVQGGRGEGRPQVRLQSPGGFDRMVHAGDPATQLPVRVRALPPRTIAQDAQGRTLEGGVVLEIDLGRAATAGRYTGELVIEDAIGSGS